MPTGFIDPDDGAVVPEPDAAYDGTQFAKGGVEIQFGAKIVLDPSLYVLAGVPYTLIDYTGSDLTFVPAADLTTQNLNNYLDVDGSQLVGLTVASYVLDPAQSKIFVTLAQG